MAAIEFPRFEEVGAPFEPCLVDVELLKLRLCIEDDV
jgi:hypothetical protein